MSRKATKPTRLFAALASVSAIVLVAGCSTDSTEETATFTSAVSSSSSTSISTSEANSAPTQDSKRESKEESPDNFALPGNKHAFRIGESYTGCWFIPADATPFMCNAKFDDPPSIPIPGTDSRGEANAIFNLNDNNGFVYGYSQLGGGHDSELPSLEVGKSVTIEGITCTVAGHEEFSCSQGSESFSYSHGTFTTTSTEATPRATTSENSLDGPGTDCGTYTPTDYLPASNVVISDDSAPIGCDEVLEVLAEYETFRPDGTYGQRHMVPFDGWMCSIGGADYSNPGQRVGPGCLNDSRGVSFSMSTS